MVRPQGGLPVDCSAPGEDCAANPGRTRSWRGSPEAHHRRAGSRTASSSSEESTSRYQAPAAARGEPFSALFRWLSGAVTPREARTTTPFAQTFLSRSQNSIAAGRVRVHHGASRARQSGARRLVGVSGASTRRRRRSGKRLRRLRPLSNRSSRRLKHPRGQSVEERRARRSSRRRPLTPLSRPHLR